MKVRSTRRVTVVSVGNKRKRGSTAALLPVRVLMTIVLSDEVAHVFAFGSEEAPQALVSLLNSPHVHFVCDDHLETTTPLRRAGLRVRNAVDLTALARRAGNSVAITFDDLVHNLFDGYAVRAGWVDSDVKVPSLNTPAQVKNVVQLGRVSLTVYALIKGDAQETYDAKHNWVTTVDGDRYMSDSDIQVLADGIVTDLAAVRSHPSDRTTPGGPTRRTTTALCRGLYQVVESGPTNRMPHARCTLAGNSQYADGTIWSL